MIGFQVFKKRLGQAGGVPVANVRGLWGLGGIEEEGRALPSILTTSVVEAASETSDFPGERGTVRVQASGARRGTRPQDSV